MSRRCKTSKLTVLNIDPIFQGSIDLLDQIHPTKTIFYGSGNEVLSVAFYISYFMKIFAPRFSCFNSHTCTRCPHELTKMQHIKNISLCLVFMILGNIQ